MKCLCVLDNLSISWKSAATRNYCKEYGERLCEDSEKLLLMEANDNHEEEHPGLCSPEICKAAKVLSSHECHQSRTSSDNSDNRFGFL